MNAARKRNNIAIYIYIYVLFIHIQIAIRTFPHFTQKVINTIRLSIPHYILLFLTVRCFLLPEKSTKIILWAYQRKLISVLVYLEY